MIAIGCHGQIHSASAQLEARAHIDVVQATHRQMLHAFALQVVHLKALLLVGAQYPAQRRGFRVYPDGRVIRGITLAHHHVGLHRRFYADQHRGVAGRGGLPAQCAFVHFAAGTVLHQQLQAMRRLTQGQMLRLADPGQGQAGNGCPALALLLIQIQLCRLGIEAEHTARHQGHVPGGFFYVAKWLDHRHRHTLDVGLGMGRVGPPTDILFVDEEVLRGVIDLAELGLRRQGQAAHQQRRRQTAALSGNQPLLAPALFTHGKQVDIARIVLVQAHAIHRVVAGGQIGRRLPLMALGVEIEQRNLLLVLVVTGHQHLVAQGAAVQPGKGALDPAQGVALFIKQQQAFTLACRQALVTCATG